MWYSVRSASCLLVQLWVYHSWNVLCLVMPSLLSWCCCSVLFNRLNSSSSTYFVALCLDKLYPSRLVTSVGSQVILTRVGYTKQRFFWAETIISLAGNVFKHWMALCRLLSTLATVEPDDAPFYLFTWPILGSDGRRNLIFTRAAFMIRNLRPITLCKQVMRLRCCKPILQACETSWP